MACDMWLGWTFPITVSILDLTVWGHDDFQTGTYDTWHRTCDIRPSKCYLHHLQCWWTGVNCWSEHTFFSKNRPLGRFFLVVGMSVYISIFIYICRLFKYFFPRPLSCPQFTWSDPGLSLVDTKLYHNLYYNNKITKCNINCQTGVHQYKWTLSIPNFKAQDPILDTAFSTHNLTIGQH